MKSFNAIVVLIAALLGAPAQAAKPAPPPPDTTPPAPIGDLTVMTAVRSLTLRFTATGDDGTTGTATRYEVSYAPVSCTGDPGTWTPAPRSDLQKPVASGSPDAFIIRPLTASATYCVAIRVRDEVPNHSGWTTQLASTLGVSGDWPMLTVPPDTSASPTPNDLSVSGGVAVSDGLPAAGEPQVIAAWAIHDHKIGAAEHDVGIRFARLSAPTVDATLPPTAACTPPFTGDCVETLAFSSSPLGGVIDGLRGSPLAVAAIPDGLGAVLVRGWKVPTRGNKALEDRTVLLERGATGWTASVLPFVVDAISVSGIASNLVYVSDGGSGFNPVTTWIRQDDPRDPSDSTLMLAERTAPGVWISTPLASRTTGGWRLRRLVTTPSGDLGVWASPDCCTAAHAIYFVRSPAAATGAWSFYDAGPRHPSDNGGYNVAQGAAGDLVVASSLNGSSEIAATHQSDFAGPNPGLPPLDYLGSAPSAWHPISADMGDGGGTSPGLSVDPCDGAIQVGSRTGPPLGSTSLIELRVATYAGEAAGATPISVDHVNTHNPALVGLPSGDVAVLTSWSALVSAPRFTSRPPQDVYLVRGFLGATCPIAP